MTKRTPKVRLPIDVHLRIKRRGQTWNILLISEFIGLKDIDVPPMDHQLAWMGAAEPSNWHDFVRLLAPEKGLGLRRDQLAQAGRTIREHLLSSPVISNSLAELVARSKEQDRPIRFFVDIIARSDSAEPPDALLACLPIEIFYHDFVFLFQQPEYVLVRYDSTLPARPSTSWTSPPSVLIVTAAPMGPSSPDSPGGSGGLTPAALDEYVSRLYFLLWENQWESRIIRYATKDALRKTIARGINGNQFDVILIICNGLEDAANAGCLELEDGPLSGIELGRYLVDQKCHPAQGGQSKQLVMLCSGSSAVPQAYQDRRGMAEYLVSYCNVQWAFGFRASISYDWAMNFCYEVFKQLVARKSVEIAVGEARRSQGDDSQWALAMLYGRMPPSGWQQADRKPPIMSSEGLEGALASLAPRAKEALLAIGALPNVGIPRWLVACMVADSEENMQVQLRGRTEEIFFTENSDQTGHYTLYPGMWKMARQELAGNLAQRQLFRERAAKALAMRARQLVAQPTPDESEDPHAGRLFVIFSELESEDWTDAPTGRAELALAIALLDELRQYEWDPFTRLKALGRAEEWSRDATGTLRALVLRTRADLRLLCGESLATLDLEYQAAQALLDERSDLAERAAILVRRSRICQLRNQIDEAIRFCLQALDAVSPAAGITVEVDALIQLGELLVQRKEYERAKIYLDRARIQPLITQDNQRLACLHLAQGALYWAEAALHQAQGDHEAAKVNFEIAADNYVVAVQCSHEAKDHRRKGWGLLGQGLQECLRMDDPALALRRFGESAECFTKTRDRLGAVMVELARGEFEFSIGYASLLSGHQEADRRFTLAAEYFEKVLRMFEPLWAAGYGPIVLRLPGVLRTWLERRVSIEQISRELGDSLGAPVPEGVWTAVQRVVQRAMRLKIVESIHRRIPDSPRES